MKPRSPRLSALTIEGLIGLVISISTGPNELLFSPRYSYDPVEWTYWASLVVPLCMEFFVCRDILVRIGNVLMGALQHEVFEFEDYSFVT